MNYDNLKKSSVQSLINGFESQGNDYVCLWCDKKFGDSAGAKSHVEKTHPLEERFKILLGGDNLLRFSPIDKALLTMMFKSVDQKTIAEGLNINYGTVRAKRKLFYEEFVSSKLKAVLFNMVFENQPQRQYNKKKVVNTADLSIPYFDFTGGELEKKHEITGFGTKDELHTNSDFKGYYHATTIIVPIVKKTSDKIYILTCDKTTFGMDNFIQENYAIAPRWDVCGEHLQKSDLSDEETKTITSADYHRCAERGILEELYLRNNAKTDSSKLKFLFPVRYNHHNNERFNNEISYCYVYDAIPEKADARIFEEYTDNLEMTVRLSLPTKLWVYEDLQQHFREAPAEFADGLGRVLVYLQNTQAYEKFIKNLD